MESPHMPRPLRALSLDGCGVRGLSELLILKRLMYRMRPATATASQLLPKPCDFFDVIGGTSTGGLVAIALGRLQMDVDECITFYCALMKDLFPEQAETWFARTFDYSQAAKGKAWFKTQTLENKLKEVIREKLGHDQQDAPFESEDTKCKVFVCATRVANRGAAVIRSYQSKFEPSLSCTIWEAALATMAMPPFFEPVTIGPLGCIYADGSVRNNNPVWITVDEIRKEFEKDSLACLVSLGTGQLRTEGLGTSMAELLHACAAIAVDTETTARLFLKEYKPLAEQLRYFRFNVEQGLQEIGVNEFAPHIIDRIDAATADYLTIREDDITRCAQMLKSPTLPTRRPNVDAAVANNRDVLMWLDALEEYETLWWLVAEGADSAEFSESDFVRNGSLQFPGTCDWITKQEQFSGWMDRSNTSHCFLHGIPGSGKTVLAAFVGKWLRRVEPHIPTLIFFCDSKDERKSGADSFFRNAIVQLLHYYPHLINQLALEMGKTGRKKVLSWVHLKSIFLRFLHEVGKLYIVVDAVDELSTLGQDVLSETISNLGASMTESTAIQTFLTSRTRADVIAKLFFCEHQIVLQRGPFDEDLRIFVSLSVDRSEELQALFEKNLTFIRELKETLLARSEGMFLLPKLLLQELKSKESMDQMRQVLQDIPVSLSEYYSQFIQRIDPSRKEFALGVFSWLACTLRPLSLEELRIGLEMRTALHNPDGRYELPNLKFSIEKACSCLVVLQKGRVQLAHSSVKRYLLKPQTQNHESDEDRMDFNIPQVHEEIAMVCLSYLSLPAFSMPLSCESRFSTRDVDILKVEHPFLVYGCQSWHTHIGLSPRESPRLLVVLAQFLSTVNCRSYIELVFSYWTFPNVTLEDVSNTLISWVSKEPTCEEELFIFNWARDLWDINLEVIGLLDAFPSEIHFLQDLLPGTAIHDQARIQRSVSKVPENFCDISQAGDIVIHESADASGQTVARKSDRFVLTESAMIDWESTMSTPRRYLQNIGIRWEVHVQNLQTQKRYARHSVSLCRREGICCSVAIAPNDQHIAVSWPEYQDDDATVPLKVKTYAWSLRWDESRSPVWRKWDWTDRQYGADYTRAAGFRKTKNSIAFTGDSKFLATPGGFYDISSGNLAFPPPLFSDEEVSGLTFSSNAEFAWGSRKDQDIVIYRRDTEEISTANKTAFHFCEILTVSPAGTSAIVLLQQQNLDQSDHTVKLSLVTSRTGKFFFDDLYSFSQRRTVSAVHEQWEYIRSFYASGGQVHIAETGKVILGLPTSDQEDFLALMFTLSPYQQPAYSKLSQVTLKVPKGSFLLSIRFQRGTGEVYGLTDQAIIWRFKPQRDQSIWETRMQREDRYQRNYLVSDYSSESRTIKVALQLGGQAKSGFAALGNDPLKFEFRGSPITKILALTQNLDRATVSTELYPLLRCAEMNSKSKRSGFLGIGSRSEGLQQLENFIALSDHRLRQYVASKCGGTVSPEISSHFTANKDGSIVACLSVVFCEEEPGGEGATMDLYCCLSVFCLNSGQLATFEKHLCRLSQGGKVIHRELRVNFDEDSNLVAVCVYFVLSLSLEDKRSWFGTNHLLDISVLRVPGKKVEARSQSPIGRLLNRQQPKQDDIQISDIADIAPAIETVFCTARSSLYAVDRNTGELIGYSTAKGREGSINESLQIFGDWSVHEIHDMRASPSKLQLLALTNEYILGLVEVDLKDLRVRRRFLSSMWGENMGNRAKIYIEHVESGQEKGINIIVCHNQQIDVSEKLDPNQTELRYKSAVIFVSELALGPWIEMAGGQGDIIPD